MYYALYRKWRPKDFDDIVDQKYVVETLRNQIRDGKIAHAYMFTGFRGTGKTTCAKIIAKAVNCLNVKDGNPCNKCEICKGIDNGSIMDVLEIDAASNNGVEDIRELREEAAYTPSVGRYRVYIIDEVHMLSIGAFNALLKIMEEPPEYVIFILATTEVSKVPATILSRCQQYSFKKISKQSIKDRLMYIADLEGVGLDESGAKMIARYANGGLRDALSILDASISFAQSQIIDDKIVSHMVAITDMSEIIDIADNILKKDVKETLKLVSKVTSEYIDPCKMVLQLIEVFKVLMLIKTMTMGGKMFEMADMLDIKEMVEIEGFEEKEIKKIEKMSHKVLELEVFEILEILTQGYDKVYKSASKQLESEIVVMRAALRKKMEKEVKSKKIEIEKRKEVKRIKDNLDNLKGEDLENSMKVKKEEWDEKEVKEELEEIGEGVKTIYQEVEEIEEWGSVLEELMKINPGLGAALKESKGYLNERAQIVFISTDNKFFLELIRTSLMAKQTLKWAISEVMGKKYRIGPYKSESGEEKIDYITDLERLAKENGVKIEIK